MMKKTEPTSDELLPKVESLTAANLKISQLPGFIAPLQATDLIPISQLLTSAPITTALPYANLLAQLKASIAPLTTKGDVLGFSTLPVRLPVGINGQVLTATSSAASGLSWTTPAVAPTYTASNGVQLVGSNFQFNPAYSPTFVNLTLNGSGGFAALNAGSNILNITTIAASFSNTVKAAGNIQGLSFAVTSGSDDFLMSWNGSNEFLADTLSSSRPMLINAAGGKVGIGYSSSGSFTSLFNVNGDITATGSLQVDNATITGFLTVDGGESIFGVSTFNGTTYILNSALNLWGSGSNAASIVWDNTTPQLNFDVNANLNLNPSGSPVTIGSGTFTTNGANIFNLSSTFNSQANFTPASNSIAAVFSSTMAYPMGTYIRWDDTNSNAVIDSNNGSGGGVPLWVNQSGGTVNVGFPAASPNAGVSYFNVNGGISATGGLFSLSSTDPSNYYGYIDYDGASNYLIFGTIGAVGNPAIYISPDGLSQVSVGYSAGATLPSLFSINGSSSSQFTNTVYTDDLAITHLISGADATNSQTYLQAQNTSGVTDILMQIFGGNVGVGFALGTTMQSQFNVAGDIYGSAITTPATPTGGGKTYWKSDGNYYALQPSGTEVNITAGIVGADTWTQFSPSIGLYSLRATQWNNPISPVNGIRLDWNPGSYTWDVQVKASNGYLIATNQAGVARNLSNTSTYVTGNLNYTNIGFEDLIMCTNTTNIVITLDATKIFKPLTIKLSQTATGSVTIVPTAGQTIDGISQNIYFPPGSNTYGVVTLMTGDATTDASIVSGCAGEESGSGYNVTLANRMQYDQWASLTFTSIAGGASQQQTISWPITFNSTAFNVQATVLQSTTATPISVKVISSNGSGAVIECFNPGGSSVSGISVFVRAIGH